MLKGLEDLKLRGKQDAELLVKVQELTDRHLKVEHDCITFENSTIVSSPSRPTQGPTTRETARIDQLSHYILRLSYCSKPELRKWFLNQECELFRLRFVSLLSLSKDRVSKRLMRSCF